MREELATNPVERVSDIGPSADRFDPASPYASRDAVHASPRRIRGTASRAVGVLVAYTLLVACSPADKRFAPSITNARKADLEGSPSSRVESADGSGSTLLEIRLFFGPEADLDLFVTDPAKELVYFGNNPSRGGGQLERDVRCGHAVEADEERVETIRFRAPRPGRYRVGVGYDRSCVFRRRPAAFRVEVRNAGMPPREERGTVAPGRFESIVLEFDVGAPR